MCDEGFCPARPGLEEGEMDSTALLNEILGSMSVVESDFTSEWMDVFGHASGKSEATPGASEDEQQEPAFFLPSQLLDQSPGQLQSSLSGWNLNISVYLHLHQNQVQFLVVAEVDLQIFYWSTSLSCILNHYTHVLMHAQLEVLFLFVCGCFSQLCV